MSFPASILLVYFLLAALVLPASAEVLATKTLHRFYDPVEFRSEMLEGLWGKKLSHLRLYSFVEGSFRQVPYQMHEWTVIKFQLKWYFPYDFYDPDGLRLDIVDQIVRIKEKPLEIKIGARQVTSNGPLVSHVEP